MRRLALLLLLCAIVLGTAAAAAGRQSGTRLPTSGTVWAVERFDGGQNTLAAFDASTGDVLGVVPIGRRPIGVTAPHGTGKVYTADERSNQLSVLSKEDFSIVKQISTGPASFPHHVMASPNGKFLYATNEGATQSSPGTVSKLDARTGELIWEFGIGTRPSEILVTPDGNTAYVSVRNDEFPGYSISGDEWLSVN